MKSVRPSPSGIVIAILEADREVEPRHYGSIATTQHALERAMRRIAKQQHRRLSDLHVCYEASGCGFWIARRLLQMGVRCDVIAPSLIPTRSGDRVKTDKRDAAKLAKMLRSNDLVAVHIPDSVDEAIRDLCRARTDAVDDLRRAKTRLLGLLRRLGCNYGGKTHWTEAHKRYLRHLKLVDDHHKRIARLETAMLTLLEDWQRKPLVEAMMAFNVFRPMKSCNLRRRFHLGIQMVWRVKVSQYDCLGFPLLLAVCDHPNH